MRDIYDWTVMDVVHFVQRLPGCDNIGSNFKAQHIDGEAFLLLDQTDIVKILGVKLGPAIKIFNSILMLKRTLDAQYGTMPVHKNR